MILMTFCLVLTACLTKRKWLSTTAIWVAVILACGNAVGYRSGMLVVAFLHLIAAVLAIVTGLLLKWMIPKIKKNTNR